MKSVRIRRKCIIHGKIYLELQYTTVTTISVYNTLILFFNRDDVSPGSTPVAIVQETRNGFRRLDGWFHGRWNISASGCFLRRWGELRSDSLVAVALTTPDACVYAVVLVAGL